MDNEQKIYQIVTELIGDLGKLSGQLNCDKLTFGEFAIQAERLKLEAVQKIMMLYV
jgi:hypothetical protein